MHVNIYNDDPAMVGAGVPVGMTLISEKLVSCYSGSLDVQIPAVGLMAQKCYAESSLNHADFRTGFQGKSESRAWTYARFLISARNPLKSQKGGRAQSLVISKGRARNAL